MAAAFCVGGPDLEKMEEYFLSLNGIRKIVKQKKNIWILVFANKESARAAQWQMDLNGAEGSNKEWTSGKEPG